MSLFNLAALRRIQQNVRGEGPAPHAAPKAVVAAAPRMAPPTPSAGGVKQAPPATALGALRDPSPMKNHGETYPLRSYKGPLFKNGVSPRDVEQGDIANCYLPATLAAVAAMDPARINRMIRKIGDDTYAVTLYANIGGFRVPMPIIVDGDLYTAGSAPAYGRAPTGADARADMELWPALIEKAYAQLQGSYEAIGNGGQPKSVLHAIYGRETIHRSAKDAEALWTLVTNSVDGGRAVIFETPKNAGAKEKKDGIHGWHTYSVLGYERDAKTGERYIKLRNPWGNSEPAGDDQDDGIFRLPLAEAARVFSGVSALGE